MDSGPPAAAAARGPSLSPAFACSLRSAAGAYQEGGRLVAHADVAMVTIISSLPVWPWMDVTAYALAVHPVDPKAAEV
ncbi:hypothetical protein [Streptomyces sp. B22F1]|uniref:hypothetical protein n=1 Tax=Streptomyces sp. B22F1 TaxID=3153566 RepID=UPI00119B8080